MGGRGQASLILSNRPGPKCMTVYTSLQLQVLHVCVRGRGGGKQHGVMLLFMY
jgi:hypothetical protein